MKDTKRVTIGSAGRLVIPKTIRQQAMLETGTELEIVLRDGGVIELRPLPREVRIEEREGLPVAVPTQPGPSLSHEEVEATRRAIREERGSD